MKANRFSLAFLRKVGAFAASFLLAADLSTAGGSLTIGPFTIGINSPSKKLAEALAPQVQEVQTKLAENRRALPIVQGSDGKPTFLRQDVASLIAHTGEDLDKAIVNVQPSKLEPLRAWSAVELRRIQAELTALPGPRDRRLFLRPSRSQRLRGIRQLQQPSEARKTEAREAQGRNPETRSPEARRTAAGHGSRGEVQQPPG